MNYYEKYRVYKHRYLDAKKHNGGSMSDSLADVSVDQISIKRIDKDGASYYIHNVHLDKPVLVKELDLHNKNIDKSLIDEPLLLSHRITDLRVNSDGKLKVKVQ